jgi:hypothetical protein
MNTIEFQATIKDGSIEVPREYRRDGVYHARVIVLADDPPRSAVDAIGLLLAQPVRLDEFRPLTREETHAGY